MTPWLCACGRLLRECLACGSHHHLRMHLRMERLVDKMCSSGAMAASGIGYNSQSLRSCNSTRRYPSVQVGAGANGAGAYQPTFCGKKIHVFTHVYQLACGGGGYGTRILVVRRTRNKSWPQPILFWLTPSLSWPQPRLSWPRPRFLAVPAGVALTISMSFVKQ